MNSELIEAVARVICEHEGFAATITALQARVDAAEKLGLALADAEAEYRRFYQLHGRDDMRTGRAWDKMRRRGDAAARAGLLAFSLISLAILPQAGRRDLLALAGDGDFFTDQATGGKNGHEAGEEADESEFRSHWLVN